jgi:shikimate dehydrogenase
MRALGIEGLSVTMPHKAEVLAALDEVSEDAAALAAVNCIVRRGDTLRGENTDGDGFLAGLRSDFDFEPEGRTCVVLGAGGAARAVVLALARAGAASVQVVNRTPSSAAVAAELAGTVGSVARPEAVAAADLVVNASSVGMHHHSGPVGASDLPCDVERLARGQVVADLVYHPLRTALVSEAARRGARASNGVSMLVHQAARAFELWTGEDAPVAAMRAAVDAHLGTVD